MNPKYLKTLLEEVAGGKISVEKAYEELEDLPYGDLGYAKIDNHREIRTGHPEVIYGGHKTSEQIIGILNYLKEREPRVLVTKVEEEKGHILEKAFPEGTYHSLPELFILGEPPTPKGGTVAVVCAGTSDLYVAEEAALTAIHFGSPVKRIYDVGVAGIHRLLAKEKELHAADVIICVAGMEGALLSVVAGLVKVPVLGVPTSVGYGTALGGIAPLLTMLNSCATGTAVLNIDNGFGAGYMATLIAQK